MHDRIVELLIPSGCMFSVNRRSFQLESWVGEIREALASALIQLADIQVSLEIIAVDQSHRKTILALSSFTSLPPTKFTSSIENSAAILFSGPHHPLHLASRLRKTGTHSRTKARKILPPKRKIPLASHLSPPLPDHSLSFLFPVSLQCSIE